MSPLQQADEVRIVDLPMLETALRMSRTPRRLEIRNAQSLRGLAIEAPWPDDAIVEGLRKLEWFAAGGRTVDDRLMDVLLTCLNLDQLTLAYTSITRPKLMNIGGLRNLSMLALPGADVDDQVTSKWHRLKSLWEINLDDTSVSVETIAWLSRIDSLRRVSLNRVPFDEAAADALAELRQVSELRLAGVSFDCRKLKPLLQGTHLEALDLSGWKINPELLDVLDTADSLKHLILKDCDLDADSLERILASNPLLYVDMGAIPGFVTDEVASDLRQRASAMRAEFRTGWRQMLGADSPTAIEKEFRDERTRRQVVSRVMPWEDGRINPQVFRPKPVANRILK
jgi:hypothetical protein